MREARHTLGDRERVDDLLRVLPSGLESILDVGTRDGYIANRMAETVGHVVALDLELPVIKDPRPNIMAVQGNGAALPFRDGAFEAVLCSEVLEHIPGTILGQACRELSRVARRYLLIGVPYRQDLRLGRPRCGACGGSNPPWGHVNSFDEQSVVGHFPGWRQSTLSLVGNGGQSTSSVAAGLMALAGSPYGSYEQEERCFFCGAELVAPDIGTLGLGRRVLAGLSLRLTALQNMALGVRPSWMHILLVREGAA